MVDGFLDIRCLGAHLQLLLTKAHDEYQKPEGTKERSEKEKNTYLTRK